MRRPTFKHESSYTADCHTSEIANEKFLPDVSERNLFGIVLAKGSKENNTWKDVGENLVG